MKMRKSFSITLKVIIVLGCIALLLRSFQLVYENGSLKSNLEREKQKSNAYLVQLDELSFIFSNVDCKPEKRELMKVLEAFRLSKAESLKAANAEIELLPPVDLDEQSILYGYQDKLKFFFDDKSRMVNLEFEE